MKRRRVTIDFLDVPDRNRNAGWIATVRNGADSLIGHGATIPEAFNHLIDGISSSAIEKTLRDCGEQVEG